MKGLKKITTMAAVFMTLVLLVLVNDRGANAYDVNATSTATVTVTIASKTIVDVTPENMDFGTNDPGSVVTQYTDGGLTLSQIQIENLGSTNLTYIWFNVTQPSTNPFGTGNNANYDPANFLVLKNTSQTSYWFIDRLEYNATTNYIYLNTPANTVSGAFGKIRNANHEFFWAINGTSSYCNTTGNTLVVGLTAHNETQTGTIDLTSTDVDITSISDISNANWGLADGVTVDGVQYCVAVSADCTKLRLYRWNPDAPGAASCTTITQQEMTINNGQKVYPGGSVIADVQMHIPYGVPQGALNSGTLTVVASAE